MAEVAIKSPLERLDQILQTKVGILHAADISISEKVGAANDIIKTLQTVTGKIDREFGGERQAKANVYDALRFSSVLAATNEVRVFGEACRSGLIHHTIGVNEVTNKQAKSLRAKAIDLFKTIEFGSRGATISSADGFKNLAVFTFE